MKILGRLLRTLCILAALLCLMKLAWVGLEYRDITAKTEEMRNTYVDSGERFDKRRHFRESISFAANENTLPEIDFDRLLSINDDIRGWIYIRETDISFPVLRGEDNQEYLVKDYTGKYSKEGSIFMDYRCADGFNDKTIIYGHNMHNGAMFGELDKYASKSYLDNHNTLYIVGTDSEIIEYSIMEAKVVSTDDQIFEFNQSDREQDLLILSTCTNDSNPYKRFVVICQRIYPG